MDCLHLACCNSSSAVHHRVYRWIQSTLHVFYVINQIDIELAKYDNLFFRDNCSWRDRLRLKDSGLKDIRKVHGSI